jgi:predicted ATPase/DNA-binding winged helix-turn-helix (wHTH) protein
VSEASPNFVYACEQWEIDLGRRELRSRGIPVPLGSRAFEIVTVLVQSASELVTKDSLMARVWPGIIVGEGTLHVHISAVRKALGPDRRLLKTASGRGYRLLGDWTPRHPGSATAPDAPRPIRASAAPPPHNFPLIVTRLVGRAAAAQHVRDLVSAYRVVTLTGPGGIGKTTLAIKAARGLLAEFDDGAWLVELGALADPALVPSTVAGVLGLKLDGDAISVESVARAVDGRHLLLMLDNCEHMIDAAAKLIETFMRLCPRVTVLATSQEILRIDGEAVYRVPALDVPAPGQDATDHVLGHSAVELFVHRTKALDAGFSPRAEDLASIAAICRRLDGIPLAIEFAAARAAVLGVPQVAAGLHDRFALLTAGRRTALSRHRTLRATLDWSHELLPDAERRLLRRLAVFSAGFTAEAAAAVMQDAGLDDSAVMGGIANLVAKSLVALDKLDAAARWHLLETVRAYALEQLAEHGEADAVARHHARYFRDHFALPVAGAGTGLSGDELARHAREIDNVRAALDWSFSPVGDSALGVDLTVAYSPVWLSLSLMTECRERCERALLHLERDAGTDARNRMWLQIALGSSMRVTMGQARRAQTLLASALDAAEALDDLEAQARALTTLSGAHTYLGEHDEAWAANERLKKVADRIGDPAIVLVADRMMGTNLVTMGRLQEAERALTRVLQSHALMEHRPSAIWYPTDHRASARAMLARVLWQRGFAEKAVREAQASLDELRPTDHQLLICRALYFGICRIAPMIGDFAAAEQANARLMAAATTLNAPFWQTSGRFVEGKSLVERGDFASGLAVLRDAFDTCRQTGWRMSYPEFKCSLAAALAGLGQPKAALDEVNKGLEASGRGEHGQRWYVPELLRIKGEVTLQQGSAEAAEACFLEARNLAEEQGALFWELRIALSRARLLVTQGRHDAAREILAPVHGRFTEGFEITDMRAATSLLAALTA